MFFRIPDDIRRGPSGNSEYQGYNKTYNMFWKKSPKEKLQKQYESLMKEAFMLSKSDRKAADSKTMEADEIMKKIEALSAEEK